MFWFLAIFLVLVVLAAILWPLVRSGGAAPSRAEHDVEVYGAQLRELDGDLARNVIFPVQAAAAKAEIGRRLLKAASEAEVAGSNENRSGRAVPVVMGIAVAVLSLGSLGLYAELGMPGQADQPLEARLAVDPAKADVATLVAQAERRLKADPGDGRGWEMVLPIYLRLGRADDALKAADNAIRLLGSTADREAMRGEAEVQAASGEVTDAAKKSFAAALRLDPDQPAARFYLALGLSQARRFDEATKAWIAILDKGPPDAPWMETARRAYEDASANAAGGSSVAAARSDGPSAEDMAAAGEMSGKDRAAMISSMVSQLADRLKSAPNDPEGWKRLMRSYSVLGDGDKARAALMQAQGVFAKGTDERRSIDDFAAALGLGGTGTLR